MSESEVRSEISDHARPLAPCVGHGPEPRPFFAEYPYFLWGEVNYDSDGDCRRPTDREWTQLDLTRRPFGPEVRIEPVEVAEGLRLLGSGKGVRSH